MTRLRLPFVNEFRDRHGKVRRYYRRPGCKAVPLPGLPGSAEFMAAYQAALTGVTVPPRLIGEARTVAGTVQAIVAAYLDCSPRLDFTIQGPRRRNAAHTAKYPRKFPRGTR